LSLVGLSLLKLGFLELVDDVAILAIPQLLRIALQPVLLDASEMRIAQRVQPRELLRETLNLKLIVRLNLDHLSHLVVVTRFPDVDFGTRLLDGDIMLALVHTLIVGLVRGLLDGRYDRPEWLLR
jgi:hypothetical protein